MANHPLINHRPEQWGPWSPNLLLVAALESVCAHLVEEHFSPESANEYFFNPRTFDRFEEMGCSPQYLDWFQEGMAMSPSKEDALAWVQQMRSQCAQTPKDHMPLPTPDFQQGSMPYTPRDGVTTR